MLSLAIAKQHDVPPPKYFNNPASNDIIGNPKHKPKHEGLPRIASSHSIPCYAVDSILLRSFMKFPPYAVVLRDIREVLVSHYAKHGSDYLRKKDADFATYLRSNPMKKRFRNDVWWYMHFQNRWGKLASKFPDQVRIFHYADLRNDPEGGLRGIAEHFGLELSDEAIAYAMENSTKEAMENYRDPSVKFRIVREDDDSNAPVYSDSDKAFLADTLKENLRFPLGYSY